MFNSIIQTCSLSSIDWGNLIVGAIGGLVTSLLAYLGNALLVVPLNKYSALRGKVSCALVFYANRLSSPLLVTNDTDPEFIRSVEKASLEIRHLAAEVRSFSYENKWLAKIFVPKNKELRDVSSKLIGISNGLFYCEGIDIGGENRKMAKDIEIVLHISERKTVKEKKHD